METCGNVRQVELDKSQVIQEVLLAPKSTWYYAEVHGDLDDALIAAGWLDHERFYYRLNPIMINSGKGVSRATAINRLFGDVDGCGLLELVLQLQSFQSTDVGLEL